MGEAAELLGISERHFRRLRDRYEADGAEGLIDRRRGRVSGRRVAVDQIEFVVAQYRTSYRSLLIELPSARAYFSKDAMFRGWRGVRRLSRR